MSNYSPTEPKKDYIKRDRFGRAYYRPGHHGRQGFLQRWYARNHFRLSADLHDYDAFRRHVGLIPHGEYVPMIVAPDKVVWGIAEGWLRNKVDWWDSDHVQMCAFYPYPGESVPEWRTQPLACDTMAVMRQAVDMLQVNGPQQVQAPQKVRYEPRLDSKGRDPYLVWYLPRKSSVFTSYIELEACVGPRPGPEWILTRTSRKHGVPMSPENFLWITPASVEKAKQGIMEPPTFPDIPDPLASNAPTPMYIPDPRQALNSERFRNSYIKGMVDFARRQQAKAARAEELDRLYGALLAKMEDFVVSKGYPASAAQDPKVLPENQKLQAARQKLKEIMWEAQGKLKRRQALQALNERNRQAKEAKKLINANNVVYTGKRGRPMKRFIKTKVRVADLNPQQKAALGVQPGEDFYRRPSANLGRMFKVYTVEVEIPNPKLQEQNASTLAQNG